MWESEEPPTGETTVGWVDDQEKTVLMRDKESAMDYRYFPEPDIPPVTFTTDEINEIERAVPELPMAKYFRYQEAFGLDAQTALRISEDPDLVSFFESSADLSGNGKKAANLFLSVILAENEWEKTAVKPEHVADILNLIDHGKISSSAAKEVLMKAMETGEEAEKIMADLGLEQKSDSGELEQWVDEVMAENEEVVEEIRSGAKPKMAQFLMGQVMKKSKGQANPQMVNQILREKLG